VQACSKLLTPSDQLVVFLWRCSGGYDDRGNTGGRESRRPSFSPAAVLGAIPAVAWAGVTVEGLGRLPGTKVELMRAWQGRRCSGATGPRRGRELGVAEQDGDGAGARCGGCRS
jgi:hypothetical protein